MDQTPLDNLKQEISEQCGRLNDRAERFQDEIQNFHEQSMKAIDDLTQNQILKSLAGLNARLAAIEARLPEEEE